jgi:aryl-alcohol dehydrogenase-like predicted oxidoreductase
MNFRPLGASGMVVPVTGLITGNFGAASGIGERLAARLVDLAIERSGTLFDTCDDNPDGQELLGKILGKRRQQMQIAARIASVASRHVLIRSCEDSLRRLGTDYLDLLQIQNFNPHIPLEETLSTLDSLIQSGKVRYIGCSDFAGWQLMKAQAVADRQGWQHFVSHQFAYSLLERACENEVTPAGADQQVGSIARSGLAGGMLAGNHGSSEAHVSDIVACLADVSNETGASKAQVALAWLLQRPTVASVMVGASCVEQLEANLDAINLHLTGNQLARLNEISEPTLPWRKARDGREIQPEFVPG